MADTSAQEENEDISENTKAKERLVRINAACRWHAAKNKTVQIRPTVEIQKDDVQKFLRKHALVITESEHLSSMIVLQLTLFQLTGDKTYLQAMAKSLENAGPDLQYGPGTSTDGVSSFLDFRDPLPKDMAQLVMTELQEANSQMAPLSAGVIMRIHEALCSDPDDSEARLRANHLGFFLELCYTTILEDSPQQMVKTEVESALRATEIHHRHISAPAIQWTPSNGPDHTTTGISQERMISVLTAVRDSLRTLNENSNEAMDAVIKQHGGLLKHSSITDLMEKLGSQVDKPAVSSLLGQLGALHANIFTAINNQVALKMRQCIDYLDKIIVILSSETQ